jgi:menaquinone-9 beta-reductase
VIVVGGGPAGSTAAWHLADAGDLDVLVVDRRAFPRDKICGGALVGCRTWPDEFPGYAAIEPDLRSHSVSSLQLCIDRAPWWERHDEHFFDHVQRAEFDDLLLQAALARSGVSFQVFDVKTVERLADGTVRLSDGTDQLTARAVIGADGVTSRVARTLGNPVRTGNHAGSCLVRHVACNRPHETAAVFYLWASQPGYGYLFPTAEGYCVGVGYIGEAGRRVKQHLADLEGHCMATGLLPRDAVSLQLRGAVAPTTSVDCVAGDGVLLTGDAAGLISQLSGEGIYYAMKSGQLAGQTLAADLDGAAGRYAAAVQPLLDEVTYVKPIRPRLLHGALRVYLGAVRVGGRVGLGDALKRPFVDRFIRQQGS